MCGRFFIADESENALLARMLEEAARRQQAIMGESCIAAGEVLPASTVAAITVGRSGKIGVFPMTWGYHLPPHNKLIINTRSETAMEKPLFRASMLERRCLIPCSWYFEWEVRDGQQDMFSDGPSLQIQAAGQMARGKTKNRQKVKYAIRPKTPGILYLAAIYRYEENQKLPALSILTRSPAPEISFIHDRMPVIFSDRNYGAWLDRAADPQEVLKRCEQEMAFYPVDASSTGLGGGIEKAGLPHG